MSDDRDRAGNPAGPVAVPARRSGKQDGRQGVVDTMTVLGALERLSPEHREVLVEMYYRGRTVTETAETLGVPPGTVKSRSYYALRAMRAAISGGPTEAVT